MLCYNNIIIIFFRFVNPQDESKTDINNAFNVPEVSSPMVKRLVPKTSTPKKNLPNHDKKTVQIHTLSSKTQKIKSIGMLFNLF